MQKTILLILLFPCLWTFGQTPANDPHWQLIWQDDFNSTTLDNTKWTIIDWADGNNATLYIKDNVTINNGNLVLTVRNNPVNCASNHPPTIWGARIPCIVNKIYPYNSGWVETKQAYNTQYGYIESRIKLPYGYGFWPAFWTFIGSGVSGSNAAEIDIFEMLGGGEFGSPDIITTNLHTEYPDIIDKFQSHTPTNFNYTDWHVYAVEWSPSKIIWYVDGSPARVFPNHGIIDPVRIILNLAIQPDYLPPTSPSFTDYMYVDFVKVYNLKNDCNTNINVCNYNFNTHDNRVKKNITIGNGSCTNSLTSGSNVYLRASEGVLINGDFTVPVGAELYIDVNSCYE